MHRWLIPAAVAVLGMTVAGLEASAQGSPLVGRWDLTVSEGSGTFPSWIEVKLSGNKTLVGSYVARGGSARPIAQVFQTGEQFKFSVPVQWESGPNDISFAGQVQGDSLKGTMRTDQGKELSWTGVRAPSLTRSNEPRWGEPIELFTGKDLTGWQPRRKGGLNGWKAEDGLLRNKVPGMDLVTLQTFDDFKLHVEFRYPKGSNSGIYLRGRYEAQIEDNYGRPAECHLIGGIYGFLTPRINAARPAGEWQTYDFTLVGRHLTTSLNGEEVITRQEIPGITGGALDSREGEPGPLMLQGDHGPIDFRRLTLTPAR